MSYLTLMLSSIRYRPASTVPSSDMCCETTLGTRTIIAEVACVGPFPSVGSHMCREMTLLTRTIPAEVARILLRRLHLLLPRRTLPPPLRLATTTTTTITITALPLPLHPVCVLVSAYSRRWVVRLACM